MRNYKSYINNLQKYKGIDLINTSGIIKINIGQEDSYITYGSSIAKAFITTLIQLEHNNGMNRKLKKLYKDIGDSGVSVDILEILESDKLKEKSKEYIEKFDPTLNYQRTKEGFTEEHKRKLSKCKRGEKHNRAKLTENEARQIKILAIQGKMTSTEISEHFKISPEQVRKIKLGLAWSHIKIK